VPAGGASAIAEAIIPLIEAAGGAVVTGADVASVIVEGGRAAGVRLAAGQEVRSGVVSAWS
jgi:all-trans-retinol 13,14-reductase